MKDLKEGSGAAIKQAVITAMWGFGASQELIARNAASAWMWLIEDDGLTCRMCDPKR